MNKQANQPAFVFKPTNKEVTIPESKYLKLLQLALGIKETPDGKSTLKETVQHLLYDVYLGVKTNDLLTTKERLDLIMEFLSYVEEDKQELEEN
jgi:hypothetical protein